MNPPWIQYPDYQPNCAGFRMGDGEDYLSDWWKFWNGLDLISRRKFLSTHNPPAGWEAYVPTGGEK